MSPRESGFGKPKWKREPREIAASSAAPELSQQTPEPFCADNSEPSDGWQSRPGADVGLTELGGDWRKRRKGGFHKHDVPRLVLSDRQWRRVARFLTGKRGDPGRTAEDNRRTLEGIIWIFRTGAPWRDLPAYFGKWNSVYRTFKRWCDRGIFLQLFLSLAKKRDLRVVMVDGTFIKVHQHGTGARRGGRDAEGSRKMQAIGLTKGGLNTKLMALVDRNGRLVRFSLVPGNAFEAHQLASLLEGLPVKEISTSCWATRHTTPTRFERCLLRWVSRSRSRRLPGARNRSPTTCGRTREGIWSRTFSATSSISGASRPGFANTLRLSAPAFTW